MLYKNISCRAVGAGGAPQILENLTLYQLGGQILPIYHIDTAPPPDFLTFLRHGLYSIQEGRKTWSTLPRPSEISEKNVRA